MTFAEHEEHFRLLQQVKDERNAALAVIEKIRAVAVGLDDGPSIWEVDALRSELKRLCAERQEILDAGGDLLWAGGATTLPEAVAGALRALDAATRQLVEEYRRAPKGEAP